MTIIDVVIYFIDMNPKKPKERKSRSAGISLEPDLISAGKDHAKKSGLNSLSSLVRVLLVKALNEAADASERAGDRMKTKGRNLKKRREQDD